MTNRILVTYTSRTGWTVGVAEAIASTLTESGLHVDVFPMPDVKDLSAYDAVVAGSGINGAAWRPECGAMGARASRRAETQTVCSFPRLYDAGDEKRGAISQSCVFVAGPGQRVGETCQQRSVCGRVGHQQSPRVQRQAGIPHERPVRCVEGRRSPRLGRHPQVGGRIKAIAGGLTKRDGHFSGDRLFFTAQFSSALPNSPCLSNHGLRIRYAPRTMRRSAPPRSNLKIIWARPPTTARMPRKVVNPLMRRPL